MGVEILNIGVRNGIRGTMVVKNKENTKRPLIHVAYVHSNFYINTQKIVNAENDPNGNGYIILETAITAKIDEKLTYMNIQEYEMVLLVLKNSLRFDSILSSYENHDVIVSQTGSAIDGNINFFDFHDYGNIEFSKIDYNAILRHYAQNNIAGNVDQTTRIMTLGDNGGESYDYYRTIDYSRYAFENHTNIDYTNITDIMDIISFRYLDVTDNSIYPTKSNAPFLKIKLTRNEPDSRYTYSNHVDQTNHEETHKSFSTHLFQAIYSMSSNDGTVILALPTKAFEGGVCL